MASLESLRGLEGIAARDYFSCLSSLLPPEFPFTQRLRRLPNAINPERDDLALETIISQYADWQNVYCSITSGAVGLARQRRRVSRSVWYHHPPRRGAKAKSRLFCRMFGKAHLP